MSRARPRPTSSRASGSSPDPGGTWTRPLEGSSYPCSLVASNEDPAHRSVRLMGAIMAVMILAAYYVMVPLTNTGVVFMGSKLSPEAPPWESFVQACATFATPWGLWASHLGLAVMILVVWAYLRFIHHRPMRWLWSISPGVRVRYGIVCFGASLVVIGAFLVYNWFTGPGWAPVPGWGWYALAIVLTTPLQALAEEVLFRGYLMQTLGSVLRNPWFPILVSAMIFAFFHGTQNPWLFASRFLFGVLAGILVWRTGGLEAAVAIHMVNNLCAFGLALFTGTLVEVRTTTAVVPAQTIADVTMFALCAGACWGIAKAMRVPIAVPAPRKK